MSEFYHTDSVTLYNGDTIEEMTKMIQNRIFVDKVITSPPYNLGQGYWSKKVRKNV